MSTGSSEPELQDVKSTALPQDILSLLGKSQSDTKQGDPVHFEIAEEWEKILTKGLEPDTKNQLVSKYPPIKNCLSASPPKLNLEIKGAVAASALRREERMIEKQHQIAACLSALGKIVMTSVNKTTPSTEDRQMVGVAGDAARLIADLFHSESQSRRILLRSGLNDKVKSTLDDAQIDEWLFGSNLGERLQHAKALEKSSIVLKKSLPATPKPPAKSLNSKRPPTTSRPLKIHHKSDGRSSWQQKGGGYQPRPQRSQHHYQSNHQPTYQKFPTPRKRR